MDPEIATAQIMDGILTYRTFDPNNFFQFKQRIKETYCEALLALENFTP
jgi:hypothetical protein